MPRDFFVLTEASLITCVVQKGKADGIIAEAYAAGAQGATVHYAHGHGVQDRLGVLGVVIESEKEVVLILVANEQVPTIFERLYRNGELDIPGRGLMYVTALERAATYIPEAVRERLRPTATFASANKSEAH